MGEAIKNTDIYVEQISAKMPDIIFCIGGKDNQELELEQVEVYRGSELLQNISLEELSDTGADSELYLLLDVSLSISSTDFEAAKQAISSLCENKSSVEKIILMTFGDEVNLVLDGTEQKEAALDKIRGIERSSHNTSLFEGIQQVTTLVEQRESGDFTHTAAIVITDGMDTSLGNATLQEALHNLNRQGIPLYGLANVSGERESINQLGEFARSTGGSLETWKGEEIEEAMDRLLEQFRGVKLLTAKASNNLVSYQSEQITIMFKQWNFSKNVDVYTEDWIPDLTAPEITEVTQTGDSQLLVTFSEPVSGMAVSTNYQLSGSGALYVPLSVQEKDGMRALLSFGADFEEGAYELSCVNMTDISMEENQLTKSFEISLTGRQPETETITAVEAEPEQVPGFWQQNGLILLIAALLLGLFSVVMYRVKKRHGPVVEDSSLTPEKQFSAKKHIAVASPKGIDLVFYPQNCGKSQAIRHTMIHSLIVGRSDICEVYFDDAMMSRQHFALEYENGKMLIQDLDTVNGTYVNGVRLKGKRLLQKRDVISAGSLELMVDWKGNE